MIAEAIMRPGKKRHGNERNKEKIDREGGKKRRPEPAARRLRGG